MSDDRARTDSRRNRAYRRIISLFLAVLLALTFLSRTLQTITLPRVRTETPARGSLVKILDAGGTVEPRETIGVYTKEYRRAVLVSAAVGARVAAGQILAVLELQELAGAYAEQLPRLRAGEIDLEGFYRALVEPTVATLKLELEQREKTAARLHSKLATARDLQEAGIEPLEAVPEAEEAAEGASVEIERAKDALEQAREDALTRARGTVLAAPVAGVVTGVNVVVGGYPDSARPAFVLVRDTRGFQAVVTVDRRKAELAAVGEKVETRVSTVEGRTLEGTIAEIRDTPGQRGESCDLVVELPADQAIRGGERAEIYLSRRSAAYPLLLSSTALARDDQGYFVWVLRERRGPLGDEHYVAQARVQVADSDDAKTAVSGGVDTGESYVVWSSKPLANGQRVLVE